MWCWYSSLVALSKLWSGVWTLLCFVWLAVMSHLQGFFDLKADFSLGQAFSAVRRFACCNGGSPGFP